MGLHRIRILVLAVLLILPPVILAQDAPTQRLAEPDAAAQKQSEKVIRDLFKEEYSKKTPADQQALAKKLLQQGIDTKDDPATKYVLFQEAMEIAAKYGDVETAMAAVTETGKSYEIDGLALKAKTLGTMMSSAKSPEAAGAIADACLDVIDEAVREEKFDVAKSLAPKAEAAAKASKDAAKTILAQKKGKEIADLQRESQKAKEAAKILETNPADPNANLTLGRYLLVKGDTEKALPLLSKGADPLIRAAVDKELAAPTKPEDQVAAGDAWLEAAEKEKNAAIKVVLLGKAKEQYEKAVGSLSGIAKTRVEKKLAEFVAKVAPGKVLEGAIGIWKLDEGRGTDTRDSLGRNHGILKNGANWAVGKFGYAVEFDGQDDYISVGVKGMPAANAPQTITLWFKVDSVPETPQNFLTITNDAVRSSIQPGFKLSTLVVWRWGGAFLVTTSPPAAGQWHHFAYTFDGSTHRLYVNGELMASSQIAPQTAVPDMLEFGRWTGGSCFFKGLLDEVHIYRRALSDMEIRSLAK